MTKGAAVLMTAVAIAVVAMLVRPLLSSGFTTINSRSRAVYGQIAAAEGDAFYAAAQTLDAAEAQRLADAIRFAPDSTEAPKADAHPCVLTVTVSSGRQTAWTLLPDPVRTAVTVVDGGGRMRTLPRAEAAHLLSQTFFDAFYHDFRPWALTIRMKDSGSANGAAQAVTTTATPTSAEWTHPLPEGERTETWAADGTGTSGAAADGSAADGSAADAMGADESAADGTGTDGSAADTTGTLASDSSGAGSNAAAANGAATPLVLSDLRTPTLSCEAQTTRLLVSFRLADGTVTEAFSAAGDWRLPTSDGPVVMIVRAERDAAAANAAHGSWIYELPVEIRNAPVMKISATTAAQGDFIGVAVENPPAGVVLFLKAGWLKSPIRLLPWNDRMAALVEIPVAQAPGAFKVTFLQGATDDAAKAVPMTDGEFSFSITEKAFQKSVFSVSKTLQDTRSDENLAKDSEKTRKARATSNPTPLWNGAFQWPISGTFGTGYGAQRLINGQISYRHSGIDISAPRGTPVQAPNDGKVVLAETLIVSGNTVILDHGMGLFSSLLHMDSLVVKPGDSVKKGDVVGYVGSTGFSTGPHLHWTVVLHGSQVDGHVLVNGDPLGMARN